MIDSAKSGTALTSAVDGRPATAPITGPSSVQPRRRTWWLRTSRADAPEVDLADVRVRADAWIPIAMVAVVVAAFLLRFSAAQHLSSHVDEAASVMAAQ